MAAARAAAVLLLLALQAYARTDAFADTPYMGWNSWNKFNCNINELIVKSTIDAFVRLGLASYGYTYVNLDDCWQFSRNNATDEIEPDPYNFPSGMKYLADYAHAHGLKFGLYSDSGTKTCAGRPGSLNYEEIDAITYASWGVDFLKYDNCNTDPTERPSERYQWMSDALRATGRPIIFALCEWGLEEPWLWARDVGHSWRTTGDIEDQVDRFLVTLDHQIGLSPFAGPGGWNDPDMLEVGNGGMPNSMDRAQFALWCLLKAPLLLGNDIRFMKNTTLAIVTNKELIALNQDRLGVQGDLIWQQGPYQIWATILENGDRAAVFFNRNDGARCCLFDYKFDLNFERLGLRNNTVAVVRDLYLHRNLGTFRGHFTAGVLPFDSLAIRISPNIPENLSWRPWHGMFGSR